MHFVALPDLAMIILRWYIHRVYKRVEYCNAHNAENSSTCSTRIGERWLAGLQLQEVFACLGSLVDEQVNDDIPDLSEFQQD